ncbi:Gfo/Idh/MocA family oxidoreductase [Paenibacillus sp. CC-CFT747]|nr:Gfo/Idh/MocA family oxidoreductase [Paenibacillus sp. CC-CFT747]
MLAAEPGLNGVMIATRCTLHTEMALKVLPARLPVFLEKPVATNLADWKRLHQASLAYPTEVLVSFPLRVTPIVQLVKEIIDSGKIGSVEHVQAYNNVPYGRVYYQSWYRNPEETGGLFLQKANHDFDYLNAVLGLKPLSLCAMTSKQIFKGNKPAGLTCEACEDNRTCLESALRKPEPEREWNGCCFAEDTGNEDSGSVLIRYETGMHVTYSQNFFVRGRAASRGARFMGYKGTLEFDFYQKQVRVYLHHSPRVETYDIEPGEGHHGGDTALARNYLAMLAGREKSIIPLEAGLTSALMGILAKESAEHGRFCSLGEDLGVLSGSPFGGR